MVDLDYLSSNCTTAYDESTEVDNSLSTAVTNYLIGVIGILSALCLVLMKPKTSMLWFSITFFLLNAVGYIMAGAYHHFAVHYDDFLYLYRIGIAATVAAIPFLEFTLTNNWLARGVLALASFAVAAAVAVVGQDFLAAVWSLGTFFVLMVLYAWKRRDFTKSLGCAMVWIGFAILGAFAPTCGSPAQKDCFQDCIFPEPTVFNHNGLFHIFVAAGVLFLGVGEAMDPGMSDGSAKGLE